MDRNRLIIVILVVLLLFAAPFYGWHAGWGAWPSGGLGAVLFVVLLLMLLGVI